MPKSRKLPYKAKRTKRDAGKPKKYHGKEVVDATSPLSFVVTRDDCSKSKPNNPEHCAGAEALRRTFPSVVGVHVHRSKVFLEYPKHVERYSTSHSVRDQILKFDNTGQFDPGTYRIGAIPKSERDHRGRQNSPPDRPRGSPNSPYKRKTPVRDLGRARFHFE